MARQYMLTTKDNPFDPFTQFTQWSTYDRILGHDTLNFLARLTVSSEDLSESDLSSAILDAMEQIVEVNPSGKHYIVSKETSDEGTGS